MKINNGFSLIEVILSVAIFTILFASIIWGFSTIIKLEIKAKQNIYNKINEANEISNKYYIEEE